MHPGARRPGPSAGSAGTSCPCSSTCNESNAHAASKAKARAQNGSLCTTVLGGLATGADRLPAPSPPAWVQTNHEKCQCARQQWVDYHITPYQISCTYKYPAVLLPKLIFFGLSVVRALSLCFSCALPRSSALPGLSSHRRAFTCRRDRYVSGRVIPRRTSTARM